MKVALLIQIAFIVFVVAVCIYGLSAEIVIFVSSDLIQGAAVCGLCLTSSVDLLIRNGSRRSTSSGSADLIYLILKGKAKKIYSRLRKIKILRNIGKCGKRFIDIRLIK